MPTWRKKPANRLHLNKRYTPEQQQALQDTARAATQRLYCDLLERWRSCAKPSCKRHQCCNGDPRACLRRGIEKLPRHRFNKLRRKVIAGGPRRRPPSTHKEWILRAYPLSSLV